MEEDIRWIQRLDSFRQALASLDEAVELRRTRDLSRLEEQGLIQAFEFTHELSWNVMKDWLAWQGQPDVGGSRDASRAAFGAGLIKDGEVWMDMIKSRNLSSHTYNKDIAKTVADQVCDSFHGAFHEFHDEMEKRARNP